MGKQNARWSEASDVIPMFPTLVWKIELKAQLREAIGARVLAALAHLRRDLPPLSPGHGWQSVQSLHELDDVPRSVSCVHRVVPGILQIPQDRLRRVRSHCLLGDGLGERRNTQDAPAPQ